MRTTDLELVGVKTTDLKVVGMTTTDLELVGMTMTDLEVLGVTMIDLEVVGVVATDQEMVGAMANDLILQRPKKIDKWEDVHIFVPTKRNNSRHEYIISPTLKDLSWPLYWH